MTDGERVAALRQHNSALDHEAIAQLYMRLVLDPTLEGSEKSARDDESLLAALRAELMTAGGDTATPRKKKWWAVRLALMDVLLAYEEGHAFNIHLQRHDGLRVALIGMDDMTLAELKQQLQIVLGHSLNKSASSSSQSTASSADDERPSRRIKWKHVWKNNCLAFEGKRLLDEKQRLVDAGIGPGACLTFADYRPPDPRGRHKY